MIEISERYLAFGKNTFMTEVAIPSGQVIEELAREYPCTNEIQIKIALTQQPFFQG